MGVWVFSVVCPDGYVEASSGALGSDWPSGVEDEALGSSDGVSLVASVLRETPSRDWISSSRSPFDSKKDILRSVDASRKESSCRNLVACSRSTARSAVEELSEFGDELEDDGGEGVLFWCCRCH